MEPTSLPDAPDAPRPRAIGRGATRRRFIRGIAATGASTAAVTALERSGASTPPPPTPPARRGLRGLPRARRLRRRRVRGPGGLPRRRGDRLGRHVRRRRRHGRSSTATTTTSSPTSRSTGSDEGLLFVNHEYPAPFFQHGVTDRRRQDPGADRARARGRRQLDRARRAGRRRRLAGGEPVALQPPHHAARARRSTSPGPLADNPAYPGIGTDGDRLAGELLGRHHAVGHGALLRGELPGLHPATTAGTPASTGTHRLSERRRRRRDGRPPSTAGSASTTRTTRFVGAQAHRARRFRHENTAFRAAAGQAVRALHGRRQDRRRRLQVRLRPPLPAGPARGEPARSSPAARSTSRAGSPRAGAVRRARRQPHEPDQRHGQLAGGAARPSWSTRDARIAAAVGAAEFDAALRDQPARGPRGRRGRHGLHRADQQRDGQRRPRRRSAACARPERRPRRRARVHLGGLRRGRADRARRPGRAGLLRPGQPRLRQGRQRVGGHRHLLRRRSTTRAAAGLPRATTRSSWSRAPARTPASPSASRTCRSRPRAPARTSRRTSRRCSSTSSTRARRRRTRSGADPADPTTFTSCWPRGNRTAGEGPPAEPLPSMVAVTKVGRGAPRRPPR